jgi:cysteine desulfurase
MKAYLDNNATTPLAPEVLEAMLPYFREEYGNPSSFHTFGSSVMPVLEAARDTLAALIGAGDPSTVIFTSGGTESDNWALRGSVALDPSRRAIVTSSVEHPAVLETAREMQREGYPLRVIGVTPEGLLDMESLGAGLDSSVAVVSIMAANNETGVLMPLGDIATAAHDVGAVLHTDAVQAIGKIPVDVEAQGIDLLSLSAHKFHGPKGTGALYIRRGLKLPPFMLGGHQERGKRAGTYNVAGIVGLGRAAELALQNLEVEQKVVRSRRDRLERGILETCPGAMVVSPSVPRLSNTATVLFRGVESEAILTLLDLQGISASSGSACSTGSKDPSHVLLAMNVDRNCANSAIRFSLSRYTAEAEIDFVLEVLPRVIARLRSISPYA